MDEIIGQTQATPPAEADTAELGSLDAAALAFEKRDTPEQSGDVKQEAEAETDAPEPDADPDNGTTDEDTGEAEQFAEVEYDGLKLQVPADKAPELQKALLRQADYSRKMNEVSGIEKAAKARAEQAETLAQGASKLAEVLAEIHLCDARLKQYESVNWAQLRSENPAEYAATAADLQTLRSARADAETRARSVSADVGEVKNRAYTQRREAMFEALQKTFKGWDDAKGTAITQHAQSMGVQPDTLLTLTDPAIVVALEESRKYRELQKAKIEIKAKAQNAPQVVKPGQARKPDAQTDALARLRKSNSVDDAAAAFLSRMR